MASNAAPAPAPPLAPVPPASTSPAPLVPRLALRPAEAARALGVSERALWAATNAGRIPCVRIGKAILYGVQQLTDWLSRESKGGGA